MSHHIYRPADVANTGTPQLDDQDQSLNLRATITSGPSHTQATSTLSSTQSFQLSQQYVPPYSFSLHHGTHQVVVNTVTGYEPSWSYLPDGIHSVHAYSHPNNQFQHAARSIDTTIHPVQSIPRQLSSFPDTSSFSQGTHPAVADTQSSHNQSNPQVPNQPDSFSFSRGTHPAVASTRSYEPPQLNNYNPHAYIPRAHDHSYRTYHHVPRGISTPLHPIQFMPEQILPFQTQPLIAPVHSLSQAVSAHSQYSLDARDSWTIPVPFISDPNYIQQPQWPLYSFPELQYARQYQSVMSTQLNQQETVTVQTHQSLAQDLLISRSSNLQINASMGGYGTYNAQSGSQLESSARSLTTCYQPTGADAEPTASRNYCLGQDVQPECDDLLSTTERPSITKKPRLATDNLLSPTRASAPNTHSIYQLKRSVDSVYTVRSSAFSKQDSINAMPSSTAHPCSGGASLHSIISLTQRQRQQPSTQSSSHIDGYSTLEVLPSCSMSSSSLTMESRSQDSQPETYSETSKLRRLHTDSSPDTSVGKREPPYNVITTDRESILSSEESAVKHLSPAHPIEDLSQSEGPTAEPSSDYQSLSFPTEPSQLSANDLQVVYEAVYSAHPKWYNLGLALGIPAFNLDSIKDVYREVSSKCLRETILTRLRKKQLTWIELITALRKHTVGETELAGRLETRYCQHGPSVSVEEMEQMKSALSGEPTLEELCTLPVEDVWYPLGLWLGMEERRLKWMKGPSREKSVKTLFSIFLHFPVGSRKHLKFIDSLPNEKRKQARELIEKKDSIKFGDFIQDLSEEQMTLGIELIEMMSYKNILLVRALVKIGKRSIAKRICSKKGVSLTDFLDATDPASNPPECVVRYASYLKKRYRRMSVLPNPDWPPVVASKDHYTNLALITRTRNVHLRESDVKEMANDYAYGKIDKIVATKEDIQLKEAFYPILNPDTGDCQLTILMDGAPGVGKTTITRKICIDWAKGAMLQEYQLLILVPLREISHCEHRTIGDLFPADDLCLKDQVTKYLKKTSGADILIIFDGFDELSSKQRKMLQDSLFLDIIKGSKLHRCSVLVTSRPYASGPLRGLNQINRHIEVLGFTEQQIADCVSINLPDKKGRQLIRKLKERLDIGSLCYIPLNCRIVLFVYERENFELPATLTELYEIFILHTIKHYAPKITSDSLVYERIEKARNIGSLPKSTLLQLKDLSKFAFAGMEKDNLVFDSNELRATHDHLSLGLMTSLHCFSTTGVLENFQFLHLTIQEFLAARHIASDAMSTDEKRQFLKTNIVNERFRMTLLFLAGLTHFKFLLPKEPLFKEQTLSSLSGDDQKERLLFMAQLVYESKSSSLQILGALNSTLDMSGHNLTKFDCLVLAYLVSATPEDHVWEVINLASCGLTGYSIFLAQKHLANPNIPAFAMTKKLVLASDEGNKRNADISVSVVTSIISASSELPLEELQLPNLIVERDCNPVGKLFSALANLQNLQSVTFHYSNSPVVVSKKVVCTSRKQINICSNSLKPLLKLISADNVQEIELPNHPEAFEDCVQCASSGRDAVNCLCEILSKSECIQQVKLDGCKLSDESALAVTASLPDQESQVDIHMEGSKVSISGLVTIRNNLSINVHCRLFGIEFHIDESMLLHLVHNPSSYPDSNAHLPSLVENIPSRFRGFGVDVNYISEKLIVSLIQASKNMKYLKLSNVKLTDTSRSVVPKFQRLLSLISPEILHFSHCEVFRQKAGNDPELVTVAQSIQTMLETNLSLQVLTLSDCGLNDIVISHIAAGLTTNTTLLELNVGGNQSITSHGWIKLFNALTSARSSLQNFGPESSTTPKEVPCLHKTLTTLRLGQCCINDCSLEPLVCGLPHNKTLKEIDVSWNRITSKGWVLFFQALQSTSISILNVSDNSFGEGLLALSDFLHHNDTITVLKALNCDLTVDVVREIADRLSHNSSLRELDISDNPQIPSKGWQELFQSLHQNMSLRELTIDQSCLRAVRALSEMLTCNKGIIELSVKNHFYRGEYSIVLLAKALLQNTTLQVLRLDSLSDVQAFEEEVKKEKTRVVEVSPDWDLRAVVNTNNPE